MKKLLTTLLIVSFVVLPLKAMAVTSASNLTTGSSNVAGTSWVTASVSPSTNALILVTFVARNGSSVQPTVSSISGLGLTWEKVTSVGVDTSGASRRTLELWRTMGTPSAGTITITTGESDTGAVWSVDQITGVDTSGSNGSGAIVQSATNSDETGTATSLTVTLGAFSSANNGTWGSFGIASNPTFTVGSGFSQVSNIGSADANINSAIFNEFKSTNDTTVDETSTIDQIGGIALEVKAEVPTPQVFNSSTVNIQSQVNISGQISI